MKNLLPGNSGIIAFGLASSLAWNARAEFAPIPLTSDSFNQDLVVERTAPPPLIPGGYTTASMTGGTNNSGYGWYERGYNTSCKGTGLPLAGSTFTSDVSPDHDYTMAPSYTANNAVLIDSAVTNATLTPASPAPYASLSFLTSSDNGGTAANVIRYTVHHQDGTAEMGTFDSPDWFDGGGYAYMASGRVDIRVFNVVNVNSGFPRLYPRDITLSNTNSPVTAIDLAYAGGNGHSAVFAVSGAAVSGAAFTPIAVTGYNQDMVVEAGATKPEIFSGVTTATMDEGGLNAGNTWYEQRYNPGALATGLPAAGSTVVSAAAPDHRYLMPSSYTANNAVLIDSSITSAALTPVTPAACSALSFLAAAGRGPATNDCIVCHADGTSETNSLIIPDWCDSRPAAFIADGCVSLDDRRVNLVNGGSPRLYAMDFALANAASPVTNMVVISKSSGNSHTIIFAVSGATGKAAPRLSIAPGPGGSLTIGSTAPGTLQSTTLLNGTNAWHNEGLMSGTITIAPLPGEPRKFYRVVVP